MLDEEDEDEDDDEEEMEDIDDGYTISKRAYLNRIGNFEAVPDNDNEFGDDNNDNVEGKEEGEE